MWFGTKIVNFDYVTKSKLNNLNVLCYKIYCKKKRLAYSIRNQASLQHERTMNQSFREYVFTVFLPTFSVEKESLSSLDNHPIAAQNSDSESLDSLLKRDTSTPFLPSSRCQIMPAFWPINTCSIMKLIK